MLGAVAVKIAHVRYYVVRIKREEPIAHSSSAMYKRHRRVR